MSNWETVSVKYIDGQTEHRHRRNSGMGADRIGRVLTMSKPPQFEGNTFIIPHEVCDGYIVRANDTSNHASINQLFNGESYTTELHKDSLWTYTMDRGAYEWHDDILEELPDWVKVGGNWLWMDR